MVYFLSSHNEKGQDGEERLVSQRLLLQGPHQGPLGNSSSQDQKLYGSRETSQYDCGSILCHAVGSLQFRTLWIITAHDLLDKIVCWCKLTHQVDLTLDKVCAHTQATSDKQSYPRMA